MKRALLVVLAFFASAGLVTQAVGAGADPKPNPVALSSGERGLVARSSGHSSELVETIEIEKNAKPSRTVVISIGSDRLPTLRRGSSLEASAEVQLTLTCVRDGERCVGSPYRYDPRIGAQLVLASSRDLSAGQELPISRRFSADCSQKVSNRNHHCPLVIDGADLETPPQSQLPCEPRECFINLVVDASHPDAGAGDKLIVGIDSDSGEILQDKGRVNAIVRAPDTEVAVRSLETRRRLLSEIPMTAGGSGQRSVVYSKRLRGLAVGDIIDARALQVASINHLDYAAFIGSQIIVADSPRGEHPGPIARRATTYRGEVTETNGFNCTQSGTDFSDPCRSPKTGIAAIRWAPVDKRGRPVPLYVNLISRAFPKRVGAMPDDVAKVKKQGYLRIRHLRELGI